MYKSGFWKLQYRCITGYRGVKRPCPGWPSRAKLCLRRGTPRAAFETTWPRCQDRSKRYLPEFFSILRYIYLSERDLILSQKPEGIFQLSAKPNGISASGARQRARRLCDSRMDQRPLKKPCGSLRRRHAAAHDEILRHTITPKKRSMVEPCSDYCPDIFTRYRTFYAPVCISDYRLSIKTTA